MRLTVELPDPLLSLGVENLSRRTRQTPTGASWHIVARVGGVPLWQGFYGCGDHQFDVEALTEAEAMTKARDDFGRWFVLQLCDRLHTHHPEPEDDGTSGQDRESYADDQDREDYTPQEWAGLEASARAQLPPPDDDILFHPDGCRPGRCVPHGGPQ